MRRNPFCAAHFAPGVLPWIGELDELVDRVCVPGACLQVIGPHGSGKTTLLVHLAKRAAQRGWTTRSFRGSHGLDASIAFGRNDAPLVVFADEAEELGSMRLLALRAMCALRNASLVVTAHRDLGLETLCEREADAPTVHTLVDHLLGGEPAPSIDAIEALLRRHDGNVREVFFELYDRI